MLKIALVTVNIGDFDVVPSAPKQVFKDDIELSIVQYTNKNFPFPMTDISPRRKSKYPKIQTHKILSEYDAYIWIDGRIEIKSEHFVQKMVDELSKSEIVAVKHPLRKNVFEEMNFILEQVEEKHKATFLRYGNQAIKEELAFYESHKEEVENVPLYAVGVFARWNTPYINKAFDIWWEKFIQFTCFDQAIFSYVFRNHNIVSLEWNEMADKYFNLMTHKPYPVNLTKEDVLFKLQEKLLKQQPFALVRYGDGEAMIMDKSAKDGSFRNSMIKRQLGHLISDEELQILRNCLYTAYLQSDVIGRPTTRHDNFPKEDYWAKANNILSTYISLDKDACSIDVFYDMLHDDSWDKLLMNRKKLFYISCRNIDEALKKRFNIDKIEHFIIAPEIKFTPDYKGDKHWPTQFNQIENWIKTLKCQGELCMVGAGLLGKIYNIWFREQGGVSIDVGSVFDAWAGKDTRGPTRKPNGINEKYML